MDDENFSDKIDIDDLYKRRREIQDNRTKTYQKILNRIHTKIKTSSRQRDNMLFTTFIIPEFIIGIPSYDIAACTAYVMDKLKDNGFVIKYTYPNMLFISWAHHLDKVERNNIKKQYGITVNSRGEQVRDKTKVETGNNSSNINSLISNKNLLIKNKKDYKNISDYKPLGIYNKALLDKIKL
tara:strand:- start:315 stop:860 length:546 start_codon:yes stop_codon:yes gene_type:complete